MYKRHQFGKETEERALEWFLNQKAAKLLLRNFYCKFGEIDLIFEETLPQNQGIELVFVEVRARSSQGWVTGPESVHLSKQQRLKRTGNYFLSRYQGRAQSIRFDLLFWNGTTWGYIQNLWI